MLRSRPLHNPKRDGVTATHRCPIWQKNALQFIARIVMSEVGRSQSKALKKTLSPYRLSPEETAELLASQVLDRCPIIHLANLLQIPRGKSPE